MGILFLVCPLNISESYLLGISQLNIQPFDEDAGTGELRYVQVIVSVFF